MRKFSLISSFNMKRALLCFIFTFHFFLFTLSAQSWQWAKQGFSNLSSEGYSVATNTEGDCYLTGYFDDTLVFGSYILSSIHNSRINTEGFLVKYDKIGNVRWAIQTHPYSTAGGNVYSFSVTLDKFGNSYITGYFGDTIKFGSFIIGCPTTANVFVAKIDSNGNVKWLKQAGISSNQNSSNGIAVSSDSSGNVYVTGGINDTVTFGTITLHSIYGKSDVFVTKYDSAGNVIWAKQSTSQNSISVGEGIALDKWNNIYITGVFTDTMNFTSLSLTAAANSNDIFLVKYDSSGNVKWAKQGINKPTVSDYGYSVVTDKSGNSIITGNFEDTLYFDTNKLFSSTTDIFLSKYDSSGRVIWSKAALVLDNHNWTGYSLASDDSENIYLTGGRGISTTGNSQIEFGSIILSCSYNSSPYKCAAVVVEFDSLGNALYGSIIPSGGDDNNSIAADPTGKYIYYGDDVDNDTIFFGSDTLSDLNGESPFAARWKGDNNIAISVKVITNSLSIAAYPNPFNSSCLVMLPNTKANVLPIFTLYNVEGEQQIVDVHSYDSEYTLLRGNLATGVYILSVKYNNQVYYKKLIIID